MRWHPPPTDIIKFNVDGAYVPGQSIGACGIVARNSIGEVIAARAGQVTHVHDAFSVELRAVEMAIGVAAELGIVKAHH